MPTIKDALDIIGKLTVAEQESLKSVDYDMGLTAELNTRNKQIKIGYCPKFCETHL